ncbi:MAG: hypothetical protein R3E08_11945 [Thiotrichaceae bacterium]
MIDTDEYDQKDYKRQPSVGIDFGIKSLVTLNNGENFPRKSTFENKPGRMGNKFVVVHTVPIQKPFYAAGTGVQCGQNVSIFYPAYTDF